MVFNSFAFLAFFIAFFLVYWGITKRFGVMTSNLTVLAGSYFFYGWWDYRFLSLILLSSIADFLIGLQIHKSIESRVRKRWLYCSLFINLSVLGFFKYCNFFIESLQNTLSLFEIEPGWSTLHIILPVGISFYTFQTMSYCIDIYNRKIQPTQDPIAFFSYVSFFPQLVAGPIERAGDMIPQFEQKRVFQYALGVAGMQLILYGLFKKIVIADNLSLVVNQVFDPEQTFTGLTTLWGLVCFSIQIYCDFSGYSDIAIGLALLLGFRLSENFKTPYFSASLKEFWSRWHISLSTWFRDYVYIPMGGSREGPTKTYFNIMMTFLLSGLWHGAQVTFLIWGALHGFMLILERMFGVKGRGVLAILLTYGLVVLFWLPFRAEDTSHLLQLVEGFGNLTNPIPEITRVWGSAFSFLKQWFYLFPLGVFVLLEILMRKQSFSELLQPLPEAVKVLVCYLLLFLVLLFIDIKVKPDFIYFQF